MSRNTSIVLEPFLGVLSFFVTFFLVGLWHGRTTEFVFFGILQGGGVAINKLWQLGAEHILGHEPYRELTEQPLYVALSRGLTFTWFAFTIFWFWNDWKRIYTIFTALKAGEWALLWLGIWLSATVVLSLWEWLRAPALDSHGGWSGAHVLLRTRSLRQRNGSSCPRCNDSAKSSSPGHRL